MCIKYIWSFPGRTKAVNFHKKCYFAFRRLGCGPVLVRPSLLDKGSVPHVQLRLTRHWDSVHRNKMSWIINNQKMSSIMSCIAASLKVQYVWMMDLSENSTEGRSLKLNQISQKRLKNLAFQGASRCIFVGPVVWASWRRHNTRTWHKASMLHPPPTRTQFAKLPILPLLSLWFLYPIQFDAKSSWSTVWEYSCFGMGRKAHVHRDVRFDCCDLRYWS